MSIVFESLNEATLNSALQYLLESDIVQDDRARGICRQIICGTAIDQLTDNQSYRFKEFVLPHININCDGHCSGNIDINDLVNAYGRELELGGKYCQHCAFNVERNLLN